MNNLPEQFKPEYAKLERLDDDALDRELLSTLETTARTFVRLALIVRLKEERGQDLSSLRIGMIDALRRIAYGQLLPEVLERFGTKPALLKRVAAVPIPDQRKCLAEDGIKFATVENGKPTHVLMSPTRMDARQLKQVFAPDHLRDVDEQVVWARAQPLCPPRKAPMPVEVDKKHGSIIVTGERVEITREQLLMYLASLG